MSIYTIINREKVAELTSLKVDFDSVPYVQPYFCRAFFSLDEDREIEYKQVDKGSAAIVYDRTLKELNWDLNSEGNLIVIGADAENYGINELGELIYNGTSEGIGSMIIEDTFVVG